MNEGKLQCTCANQTSNSDTTRRDRQEHPSTDSSKIRSAPSLVEPNSPHNLSPSRIKDSPIKYQKIFEENESHDTEDEIVKQKTFSGHYRPSGLRNSQSLIGRSFTGQDDSRLHGKQSGMNLQSKLSSSQSEEGLFEAIQSRTSSKHRPICSQSEGMLCTCNQSSEGSFQMPLESMRRGSQSDSNLCDTQSCTKLYNKSETIICACIKTSESSFQRPLRGMRRNSQSESRLCSQSKSKLLVDSQSEQKLCIQSETKIHDQPDSKLPDTSPKRKPDLPKEEHTQSVTRPSHLPPLQKQNASNKHYQSPTSSKRKHRKRTKLLSRTQSPGEHRQRRKSSRNQGHQQLCRSQSAPLNYGFIDDDDDDIIDSIRKPPSAGPSPSRVATFAATMSVMQTEQNAAGGVCSVETRRVLFTKDMALGWDGCTGTQGHGMDGRQVDKEALVRTMCSFLRIPQWCLQSGGRGWRRQGGFCLLKTWH